MRIVFIAPDSTRDRFRAELSADGIQILSESADRATALMMLQVLQPELVLVETDGDLDGTFAWAQEAAQAAPGSYVCMMGPTLPSEALLGLMRVGVREYLPEPSGTQVIEAMSRARLALRPAVEVKEAPRAAGPAGQVVVVFSPKGGVGKSTLAANLAVGLYQATNARVQLVDLSLQFGDQDLLLNLQPVKTVSDLVPVSHDLDARILDQILTPSPVGVRLLSAPINPIEGESVTADHIERAFEAFRNQPGWTVVDCASHMDAVSVRAIELADLVLMPTAIDLACVRRVARAYDVFTEFGVDIRKVRLVAWSTKGELTVQDVARTLNRPINFQLPWEPDAVATSINQGIPLMIGQPHSHLATAIRGMAAEMTGQKAAKTAKEGGFGDMLNKAFGWLRKKEEVKLLTAGSNT